MLGAVLVGANGVAERCFVGEDGVLVGEVGSGVEWCVGCAWGMIPSKPAWEDRSSMR